jgi:hypothetical protein
MLVNEALTGRFVEPQQLGVAERLDGRRPNTAVENSHFSNSFPGNDTRNQSIAAMAVRNRDTQTSRHHDVERIGDVILTEKSLAAWNAHPPQLSIERSESGLVKHAQ